MSIVAVTAPLEAMPLGLILLVMPPGVLSAIAIDIPVAVNV